MKWEAKNLKSANIRRKKKKKEKRKKKKKRLSKKVMEGPYIKLIL